MYHTTIELTFYSDLYNVKQIVTDLLDFFDKNIPGLSNGDRFDLRLIFSELLCNAVIHGNQSDISKSVCLSVEVSDNTVFSIITDEGAGFDYPSMLVSLHDELNLDRENGRGMKLVFSLTDYLTFNKEGNQIQFYKKVRADG